MNPDLLEQLRALLTGAGAPADVTAAPRGGPPQQMIPVMRERVAGAPPSPVAQRGVFGAILRSAEPSPDTPMGWANEMLNPIRQGAAARDMAGQAVSAARQGQFGRMAGMAALTAMAVPGVPGDVPRIGPRLRPIDNPKWEAAWNRVTASRQDLDDALRAKADARKMRTNSKEARQAYIDAENRFQSSLAERRALLDELGKHERFLYVPDENLTGRWR